MKHRARVAISTLLFGLMLVAGSLRAMAQIQVTAANPNNATQGTVNLNVTVNGSGFQKGAKAQWFISGTTNPGGVTVNSTAFVDSGHLTANITVAVDAATGGFDIQVTNNNGRTGKGTELFAVKNPLLNYNMTATMQNYDATNEPYTLQSDGSTPAVYNPNTDSSISSYLSSSPDCRTCGTTAYEWDVDLSQSSRSFLVTLSPISGSAGPFTGPVAFNGLLRSRCFDPGNNVYSWLAIQTSDNNCAMRVLFTYNTVDYILVMSPIEPGTGTATVTCTNWNSATTTCSAWRDIPSTGVPNANVAHLYSPGRGGKMTLIGSFALRFDMSLTHP